LSWWRLREQDDDHVLGGHAEVLEPALAMASDLFEDVVLVLLPIKDFICGNVLSPIAPIEHKDRHSWLVVRRRTEEVSLKVACLAP
jgi:hypothetical protein